MSEFRLMLIRHGQSANNALPEEERVCDPGLTDLGKRQAERVAKGLAGAPISHLYSSPFLRALETVRPLAAAKEMSVVVNPHIFERGGCYSGDNRIGKRGEAGMGFSELERKYPQWQISPEIPEEGWWGREFETDHQCRARAEQVAQWITRELVPQGGCHAMVIHADFKMILGPSLLGMGEGGSEKEPSHQQTFSQAPNNTGVSLFQWTGDRFQLMKYNCTEHLSPDELSA